MLPPPQILKSTATDLLQDLDLTHDELLYLLDLAAEVKAAPALYGHALEGKNIAILFEKPSLRTKLTFDLAMKQMGGGSVFIEGPIGVREPLKDVARNLDRLTNGIAARVFLQTTVEDLARWSRVGEQVQRHTPPWRWTSDGWKRWEVRTSKLEFDSRRCRPP